jgi:hypothetical protein
MARLRGNDVEIFCSCSTSGVPGKDHHPIGWNHYIRRSVEAMQWPAGRDNAPSIARYYWIHPVVIDVAVENLDPRSRVRESNGVVVPGRLGQGCNNNYVVPSALKLEIAKRVGARIAPL